LLAAYGIPAALFAAYAMLRRRQGMRHRGAIVGAMAALMAFLNITLEVRHLYHPTDMGTAGVGQWEAWSYTAAWIAFAAALLGLGLIRRQPSLRYASLIVLLAAIIKAFGFDIHALNGVLLAAPTPGPWLIGDRSDPHLSTLRRPANDARGRPNLQPPR